ncbi:hypothetical protein N7490_012169 [Penicillium lividum]|nr:hypothetical protein N7490_012169 [Penicillium lividum]
MSSQIIQPNHGASVPDVVAVGKPNESQAEWLEKQKINTKDRVNLKKLYHMRYQHPDLDEQGFMLGSFPPGFGDIKI